nr:MAG: hypothetical protein DIU68_12730 [Chloroflexota bacterium]
MPELAQQPGYIERFTREAKVAARLEHPHIVPVYDYGSENGITYVVMRLLAGGSLGQRLESRRAGKAPLPGLPEVATLLTQLAGALDYAHSEGVIHRDIKPNNIMFDSRGVPYIVDFGLAKLLDTQDALTRSGQTLGTPAYMPPEQWQAGSVTAAADQYALAVLIYEVLTGHQPFEAESLHQLIYMHLHQPPPSPNIWREDVPDALAYVLEQALAKDPERRFPTVTDFASAFESAVRGLPGATETWTPAAGESAPAYSAAPSQTRSASATTAPEQPVAAPPVETSEVTAPVKRRRAVWLVGAVALVAVAIVALLLIGPRINPTVAATPFPGNAIGVVLPNFERVGANARDDVERSLELRLKAQNIPFVRVNETVVDAERARELSDQYNGTIVAWGSVAEAGMYVNFEITPRSSRVSQTANFDNLVVDAKELESFAAYIFSGMDGLFEYLVNFIQGQQLYYSGDYTAAIEAFNRAAGQVSETQARDIRADALYFMRGNARYALNDLNQAVLDYGRAIELNDEFAFAYGNRGNVHLQLDNDREALADFTRAIELDPTYANAYSGRAMIYNKLDRYNDAIADFTRAIELDTDGFMHQLNYSGRAFAYYLAGDYENALADYAEITAHYPDDATGFQGLAMTLSTTGDYTGAVEAYTRALEIDPENSDAYQSRAILRIYLGDAEGALADYSAAIERVPGNWLAYNGRALIHSFTGDYEQAIADYNEALRLNPNNAASLSGRGIMYLEIGQTEQAIADLTAAIEGNNLVPEMQPVNYVNRGHAHYLLGDYDAAVDDLTAAIALDATYADAYHLRAWVYNAMEEPALAAADCAAAVDLWGTAVVAADMPANGGEISADVAGPGDQIHVAFDAPAGARLTVSVTAGEEATLDPVLLILDPAGEPIACNDDADDSTLNSRLENIELPQTGQYRLVVAAVGGAGQGEVTITAAVQTP